MRNERPGATPDGRYWLSKRPGSDKWHRTWFDAGRRQTLRASLGTSETEEAHTRLLGWWLANRSLKKEQPGNVMLTEIVRRYYDAHAKHLASEEQAFIAYNKLRVKSGTITVADFTLDAQRAFIRAMRDDGSSDSYIRRTLSVAKAALHWAHEEGLIAIFPNVKLPRDGAPRDRVLSFEESERLWWATERPHERVFLALAYCTLARPEAILEVTREMVDFDHRLLNLNPSGRRQTKKFRPTVPVADALLPWLEASGPGYLVQWRGKPIESFKTAWRAIRRRAGLGQDVVAKTIRHTMATEMRKQGVPEADIQGFLGHRAYRGRTEDYAKYRPEYLGQAVAVINSYMDRLRSSCVAVTDRCRL